MKQIESNKNYFISKDGKVIRNGKTLKPNVNNKGYYSVKLYLDGIYKYATVHRLVAKAFVSNPNNYSYVNHIDGNKQNNKYTNLEWCTNSHNLKHAYQLGLKSATGENNGRAKITQEIAIKIKEESLSGDSRIKDIALKYNVSNTLVSEIKSGVKWKHI